MRDDDVAEAADGFARVSRGCIADIALPLFRASLYTDRSVEGHRVWIRVRVVCASLCRVFREKRFKLENVSAVKFHYITGGAAIRILISHRTSSRLLSCRV